MNADFNFVDWFKSKSFTSRKIDTELGMMTVLIRKERSGLYIGCLEERPNVVSFAETKNKLCDRICGALQLMMEYEKAFKL